MALMNPKDEEEEGEEEEEISRMQTDVTDEEMALRYELTFCWGFTFRPVSEQLSWVHVSCSLLCSGSKTVHVEKPPGARWRSRVRLFCFRYESLVGSMKKKFAKKRERATIEEDDVNHNVETTTKRVFLKPQDWPPPDLSLDPPVMDCIFIWMFLYFFFYVRSAVWSLSGVWRVVHGWLDVKRPVLKEFCFYRLCSFIKSSAPCFHVSEVL